MLLEALVQLSDESVSFTIFYVYWNRVTFETILCDSDLKTFLHNLFVANCLLEILLRMCRSMLHIC